MQESNNFDHTDLYKYKFIQKLKNLTFVEKVILFGSRARGTQQSIVCPTATKAQWHEILEIIENADTLLMIDCVRLDTIDHELKQQIIKDGIIL
jgi:uncharacterized protein